MLAKPVLEDLAALAVGEAEHLPTEISRLPLQPAGPTQPDTPDARVGNLMRAFGDVLATSSTPSTPVAARRNRALRHRLALSRPTM